MKRSIPCSSSVFSLSRILTTAAILLLCGTVQANPLYTMKQFESFPVSILTGSATPQIMINTSNDHQLFFKAYNDFSDLDRDGLADTTYKTKIEYYGYFDSTKCYEYRTADELFYPVGNTDADHYCTGALDDYWSGNFLNWATMARIDTIRKILFGGHRRVDTATETVLERTYLPHDAHSWAKYYDGKDTQYLTPFKPGVDYDCDLGDTSLAGCQSGGSLMKEKIGITIGNTTDIDMSVSPNKGNSSEVYEAPPLMKVVKGNYSLWGANERWQVTWASGSPENDNHGAKNGNNPATSGIYAYSASPGSAEGIGEKNYVVRIQACVDGFLGEEKCKLYPGPDMNYGTADDNYKPIGLLQTYGDENQMEFGMVAGSYQKHAAGGVIIKNMGDFSTEVNVTTDGTFPLVSTFAGGPMATNKSWGLINAWSLYRIVGYNGADGTYNNTDNCRWGLSDPADVTKDNACHNWGNPFAEIYYQSINYLGGGGVIGDYRSNSSTGIPGLPVPQAFKDPLDDTNYCASLNVININSSVISYDYDHLDAQNYGPDTIWDSADLPGDHSTSAMTDVVGDHEFMTGDPFYVGLTDIVNGTGDELCTPKNVTSLGKVGGICPEAPRLLGSYRVAGLAYYAHTKDLRPDDAKGGRALKGMQKLDTYSVAMASSLPVIEVVHPVTKDQAVTILPACRNTSLNPDGNCAIVDFKIVEQVENDGSGVGYGQIYVNWEDSEQGGDYDQDMWGMLSYKINGKTNEITIDTEVMAKSTPYHMGFGYALGGTTDDGFHAHSGINGYKNEETADYGDDCTDNDGCLRSDGASGKTYTLGDSKAALLQDPLWYASKWGAFLDKNGNNLPDLQEEWDSQINATGEAGQDGIPDTYFYASHPKELEKAIDRTLKAILERTSSGTAAAVVSSNVRGEGALYQAYYEPLRKDFNSDEARWVGTLQALWLDNAGYTRQDCSPPYGILLDGAGNPVIDTVTGHVMCDDNPTGDCVPNKQLDNYCVDQVLETFYDDLEGKTRVRIYNSNEPYAFAPYSMQGVVQAFSSGTVNIIPNSMEGLVSSYNSTSGEVNFKPYTMQGKVTAYDPATGAVTVNIDGASINGPAGRSFDYWRIATSGLPGAYGYSTSAISLSANPTLNLTINPNGDWIKIDDILTFETQGMVGKAGERFDDWSVECLTGATEFGTVTNFSMNLKDWGGGTFVMSDVTGDFTPCTSIKVSTFNMQGEACEEYDNWRVANLSKGASGASITKVPLINSLNDACSPSLSALTMVVDPTISWLEAGDQIFLSNYTFTDKELYGLSYLWNAREELYLPGVTDAVLETNRPYTNTADQGRYIMTWIDSNINNVVDAGEYVPFEKATAANPNFLDVADTTEAGDVIDYVRGIEIPGTRNRTVYYNNSDKSANVMRLGDIINSTPTVVGPPMEAFNLLYGDGTYTKFRRQYQERRIMVYAGGNDGLLHAFNGGFYDEGLDPQGRKVVKYVPSRKDSNDKFLNIPHPLGAELWAYAPKNLLPHLKWLKDPGYDTSHVYYIDAKPRVFDANLFADDADHPNGYGTVMVVGMATGGGEMEIDTQGDDGGVNTDQDNILVRSAFLIFDITNPEVEPKLLGEIQVPDGSYATVFPAVMAARDTGGDTNCNGFQCNQWYLIFGNGPDDPDSYTNTSGSTAKLYLFDLTQLRGTRNFGTALPTSATKVPKDCTIKPITDSNVKFPSQSNTNMHLITCDTKVNGMFVGSPVVVDRNMDFIADTSYFGLVGDESGTQGQLMRFDLNNKQAPADWDPINTMYYTNAPVEVLPIPSSGKGGKYVFIGTGRYHSLADKASTADQYLYAIEDDYSDTTIGANELFDVSDVEVYDDGSVTGAGTITKFSDLESAIIAKKGWKMYLPPIVGVQGTAPATRSFVNQALLAGVVFANVYQPSDDACIGEGLSRLYALYYETGTAYPSFGVKNQSLLGTSAEDDGSGGTQYRSKKYVDLGRGTPTPPAIHSGSGNKSNEVSIFTQLSTGHIDHSKVTTVYSVRTGKISWREQ